MLDMGFLPSLRIILDKLPANRHTMLFSATMGQSVAGLVASYVHNPVRIAVEACAQTDGRTDGSSPGMVASPQSLLRFHLAWVMP